MTAKVFFQYLVCVLFLSQTVWGQNLKPGFDKAEYIETLKINQRVHVAVNRWADSVSLPPPQDFRFVSRSPRVAFDNIWDLWVHNTKPVAMIAVQGTIPTGESFLANLYAAMIPARGELQLDKNVTFKYTVANHPNAAVHVGWLVAMAYMSGGIEHKIDSCYKAGIKEFILTGHSQGGGITFLLNSYLQNLKAENRIPADVRFKTYCSAGPKPGNLFYAYEYENVNRGGWAFNVVNTADWVPDVPFSVQTVDDFTAVNPFRGAKALIKKQKFPKNLALKYAYNQLSKPSLKAQRNYQRFLGKMMSKSVSKQLPNFTLPTYYDSNYYVRTGETIVLYPTEDYYKLYSNDPASPNIWLHHFPAQYLYLVEKL